jgi:hypothetical protein
VTHPGAHFELRTQELGVDVPRAALCTLLEQARRWILIHVAAFQIDEQIFFLDANRKRRL